MKSPPSLDGVLLETSFTFDSAYPHEQRMLLREAGVVFTESWCWFLWRRFKVTVPASQESALRAKMGALESEENSDCDL
jgi:hypothetical protein